MEGEGVRRVGGVGEDGKRVGGMVGEGGSLHPPSPLTFTHHPKRWWVKVGGEYVGVGTMM